MTLPEVQKRISIAEGARRPAEAQKNEEPVGVIRARMARKMVAEQVWFERMTPERLAAEPALQRQLDSLKRSLLIGFVQSQGLGVSTLVSEKEARARYASIQATLQLPASYTLRHVYLRVDEGSPAEAWTAAQLEAEKVRGQMLVPGVDLDALVAASSDSEDAVSGGWIRRLKLGIPNVSQAFEAAVRKLKPGEVSPPVETRRGYQVLLLVNSNPSRTLSFEEVREQLVAQIVEERRQKRTAEIVAESRAEDPLTFDKDALKAGDPQGVILHGPKTRLTLGDLRAVEPQLAAILTQGAAKNDDTNQKAIEALIQSQTLLSLALRQGIDRRPDFVAQWDERRRSTIVEFVGGGLAREKIASVPAEELQRFYEDNKMRFATPRRLHLVGEFLTHTSDDLYATFARAEGLKRRLEAGESLQHVIATQAGLKGEKEDGDFGWVTHEDLAARGRLFHDTVVAAKVATWIGPVKWEHGYAVVRVEGIQEPASRPYTEVASQVRRAYTRRRLSGFREAIEAEAFKERHGELNPALTETPAATASR